MVGKITQVIGPVVDVVFEDSLPAIYDALHVKIEGGNPLVLETQKHLGLGEVRSVAMSSTDGLFRGQEVLATGSPITVPVGSEVLGRMFDVVGEAIDGLGQTNSKKRYPIHRKSPELKDQQTKA